jgi:hypothetical protein
LFDLKMQLDKAEHNVRLLGLLELWWESRRLTKSVKEP